MTAGVARLHDIDLVMKGVEQDLTADVQTRSAAGYGAPKAKPHQITNSLSAARCKRDAMAMRIR
jgi:hypothetical protein